VRELFLSPVFADFAAGADQVVELRL